MHRSPSMEDRGYEVGGAKGSMELAYETTSRAYDSPFFSHSWRKVECERGETFYSRWNRRTSSVLWGIGKPLPSKGDSASFDTNGPHEGQFEHVACDEDQVNGLAGPS